MLSLTKVLKSNLKLVAQSNFPTFNHYGQEMLGEMVVSIVRHQMKADYSFCPRLLISFSSQIPQKFFSTLFSYIPLIDANLNV